MKEIMFAAILHNNFATNRNSPCQRNEFKCIFHHIWMTLVKSFIYIFLCSRVLNNRLSPDLKRIPMLNMANRFIKTCVIQSMSVLNNKFQFDGHQNQTLRLNLLRVETFRKFSSETNGPNISVVGYNEVKNLSNHPGITLIDVREPNELQETGSIPKSVNIPCEKIHVS